MAMWKKIFGSSDDTKEQQDNKLELQMQDAIRRCEADKAATQTEMQNMYKHAEDVIMDTYSDFFENAHLSYYRDKHREGLLERYPQVKEKHASEIKPEMAKHCDRIVNGYLNNAKMLQTKVQFFDKMIAKYNDSLDRLRAAKKRMEKLERMGEHDKRLEKMNKDTSHTSDTLSAQYEMDEITREFEHKEEYYKQLEQLKQQYGDDEFFDHALDQKAQLDNMMNEM